MTIMSLGYAAILRILELKHQKRKKNGCAIKVIYKHRL